MDFTTCPVRDRIRKDSLINPVPAGILLVRGVVFYCRPQNIRTTICALMGSLNAGAENSDMLKKRSQRPLVVPSLDNGASLETEPAEKVQCLFPVSGAADECMIQQGFVDVAMHVFVAWLKAELHHIFTCGKLKQHKI